MKALTALIRAEKAAELARTTQSEASRFLKAEASAERKRRDHELYKIGGLLELVGLIDKRSGKSLINLGELTGALAEIAHTPTDDARRAKWKQAGNAILDKAKAEGIADWTRIPPTH